MILGVDPETTSPPGPDSSTINRMVTDRDEIYVTPLGTPQPEHVAAFWERCRARAAGLSMAVPPVWCFGDTAELADELIELVISGPKRATAGAVADYDSAIEAIPSVGDLSIVTDGSMRPRALLEVTDIRIGPLSSVDEAFAYDEGEGDRTVESWLDAHTWYFARSYARLGLEFDAGIPVVFERFAVRYAED
jgi:uncharacterized protein YhfF